MKGRILNPSAPTGTAATGASDTASERPSLREIYEAHFGYLWHVVRRLGGRDRDLEDLVHDVFIVVQRRLHTYDPDRPLKPWLFGVAFRVVSDYRRRASFQREQTGVVREPMDERRTPLEQAEAREARAMVAEALDALPPEQRVVCVMHLIEEHTIPEISDALGVSHNTLYSRLRLGRARFEAKLRQLMLRRGSS